MAMSPSSLLAKLDELKKWQQIQQERLLRQHQTRLEETERSNYDTIQGLSAFDSFTTSAEREYANRSSQPVKATEQSQISEQNYDEAGPSFEQDYDQPVQVEQNYVLPPHAIKPFLHNRSEHSTGEQNYEEFSHGVKPKMPFLRRGTGLEKFGMQYGDQKRPFNKMRPPETAVHRRLAALRKEEAMSRKSGSETQNVAKKQNATESSNRNRNTSAADGSEKASKVSIKKAEVEVGRKGEAVRRKSGNNITSNHNLKPEKQTAKSLKQTRNFKAVKPTETENKQICAEISPRNQLDVPNEVENWRETNMLESNAELEPQSEVQTAGLTNSNNQIPSMSTEIQFLSLNNEIPSREVHFVEERADSPINNNRGVVETVITPLKIPEGSVQSKGKWFSVDNNNELCLMQQNQPLEAQFLENFKALAAAKFGEVTPVEQPTADILREIEELASGRLQPNETVYDTPVLQKKLIECLQELILKGNADTTAQRELQVFEQLEQRVMNSSFCSTNSSILELLSSTPFKKAVQVSKSVQFKENRRDSGAKRELEFEVESDESTVNSEDLEERTCSEETSSSAQSVIVKQNACVMTDDVDFSEFRVSEEEEALKARLRDLDREISSFRAENAKLQKLKEDVENERRQLQRSKKKLEQELQEERTQMEFELGEEKKKMAKEKMVFERYVKDHQNKPTKKEREEISTLKCELANVKETLKLKETRNGTTQARLRNQLKTFEKENANLKEEVEKLQIKNAKLTASQKIVRKPSETKMLHEINKNLTKLTQDAKVVKQLNQAEKSMEKLDDSLVMLEERKRRRKRNTGYETEYRQSYDRKSDSDDSDVKNRTRRKSKSSCEDVRATSPVLEKSRRESSGEKENDRNSTNCDMTTFRNLSNLSIENNYEQVFGKKLDKSKNNTLNDTQGSTGGKQEKVLEDGSKETKYSNGNVKIVSADGNFIRMEYFNGDIKETKLLDGSIKYYYAQTEMWQTSMANGDEILEFSDGQIEKRFAEGNIEVTFPNGVVKFTEKGGTERITYPDGSVVNVDGDDKILLLPNGQKEIHTKEHKRREYPDGTIKILYPDGLQETRYSNGRIRMKDKDGHLLMDTHSNL